MAKPDPLEAILSGFPEPARTLLRPIRDTGRLGADTVDEMTAVLELDVASLMMVLLPAAVAYASAPISGFKVGAIAEGLSESGKAGQLYLGANLEFAAQPLNMAIHAEQAAVLHAWTSGEAGLQKLATSAAPCGYCRQYLYELSSGPSLSVLTCSDGAEPTARTLDELLPGAFGPRDLGRTARFMERSLRPLRLVDPTTDELVQQALQAAATSYAPYTNTVAGCAIQTGGGDVFTGGCVENAAFNPSLGALQVALAMAQMRGGSGPRPSLQRAFLVEAKGRTSQLEMSRQLLHTVDGGCDLEYRACEDAP